MRGYQTLASALGKARDLVALNSNCPGWNISALEIVTLIDQALEDIKSDGATDLAALERVFLPTIAWDDLRVQMSQGADQASDVADGICDVIKSIKASNA